MQTIEIQKGIRVGFEDFVNGASRMDTPTLEKFFKTVGNLLTIRTTNLGAHRESEILDNLEHLVPAVVKRRYQLLHAKSQKDMITEKERSELKQIAKFIEEKSTDRVYLLAELAALRHIPLHELLNQMRTERYGKAAT